MPRVFKVELTEDELKMLIAAIRQVRYTFEVAQRGAGVEPVVAEYQHVEELYEQLHERLTGLLTPPPGETPLRRVK